MRYSISNTAEYGDLTRGPRLINAETKKEMKKILSVIQDGSFANEFLNELNSGGKKFRELEAKGESVNYEEVLKQIIERDKNDSTRAIAPLKVADGAVILDNSDINEQETVAEMERIIKESLQ